MHRVAKLGKGCCSNSNTPLGIVNKNMNGSISTLNNPCEYCWLRAPATTTGAFKIDMSDNTNTEFSKDNNQKSGGKLPVFLRLKPKSVKATAADRVLKIDLPESSRVVMGNKEYNFDQIFDEDVTQIDLYKKALFHQIENVLEGHDSLFFTMGASGSGKSYTTLGTKTTPGMVHLAVNTLFRSLQEHLGDYEDIERASESTNPDKTSTTIEASLFLDWTKDNLQKPAFADESLCDEKVKIDKAGAYGVYISMAEIYNDKVFDLFEETSPNKKRTALNVNTDPYTRKTFLAGITKIFAANEQEAYRVLERGQKLRTSHSTGSNDTSSRSHAFTCFELKHKDTHNVVNTSLLTIADLAGTERNKLAKTAGNRFQESCAINQSLMLLGQCLELQRTDEKRKGALMMNEFRSCKLTHVLLSNAFLPASTQKSMLMVTVDPFGDANSIAQIFRYATAAQDIPEPPPTPSRSRSQLGSPVPRPLSRAGSQSPTKGHRGGNDVFTRLMSETPRPRLQHGGASHPHTATSPSHTSTLAESKAIAELSSTDNEDDHPSVEVCLERIAELEAKLEKSEQRCIEIEDEVRLEMAEEMETRLDELKESYLDDRDSGAQIEQEHIDKKIRIAVDSIREVGRVETRRRVAHLEDTIESLVRENMALKAKNDQFQALILAQAGSSSSTGGEEDEGDASTTSGSGNAAIKSKKKKRLRGNANQPIVYPGPDLSD